MRSVIQGTACLFLFSVAAPACDDNPNIGGSSCDTADDCPSSMPYCLEGVCVVTLPDGFVGDSAPEKDARVVDARVIDARIVDAEPPQDVQVRDAEPVVDAVPMPDLGPDVGEPARREGELGEPCPRGWDLDCNADATDRCVFVGADNEVIPGVESVCSRGCDDENPCGGGMCCYPDPQAPHCLPAGFCAGRREMGDPCERDAECPANAPVCALDAATGSTFCTHGCAGGGQCGEDYCCDANPGGRPGGAVCKPLAICPVPCASDDDCPAVQFCDEGACVPRRFVCENDEQCPVGETCGNGACHGRTARLGEECGIPGVRCGGGAPVCYEPEDGSSYCTYSCSFHRDCPATFCCEDLAGFGDPASRFCTDRECPVNLPCNGDDDCSADQFCHAGLCQERGPMDVPIGGVCTGPGDCVPEARDCVFTHGNGLTGRGDRRYFEGSGEGMCSVGCGTDDDCSDGECCRIAPQVRSDIGGGMCTRGDVCDHPVVDIAERCRNYADCAPAQSERCFSDRLFGPVCGRACGGGCPDGTHCERRDDVCHPDNVCAVDGDCGSGNRCVDTECVLGARQCAADDECEDIVTRRCARGRCEDRARPCAGDEDCDANTEVCFADQCELRDRPCEDDDGCRAGEGCIQGICQDLFLDFGDACFDVEAPCDPDGAPQCLVDEVFAPVGVCTRSCAYNSDCPGSFCCHDPTGLGDPEFFICAPEAMCDGVVPDRRPCGDDAGCLAEDFCYRGLCQDRGDFAAARGEACAGPGDCDLDQADQCVITREFGFGAGAASSFADATGGVCEPACAGDGDCVTGCCRHAMEDGAPIAFCVPQDQCPDVASQGEPCFPAAHEECDPATTDACIFAEASETFYCAPRCEAQADCPGGCCAAPDGGDGDLFCLEAADCP